MTEKISGNIELDKNNHIFVCLNGTNLEDWTFLAIAPENSVNREINILIVQIVVGALVSLLLTIIIGLLLSRQFLRPIHNLGEAALAIGERNFSYRVPIEDKDEFGHLNQVFNRVIEGLGDFEVGRIVQESMFPNPSFNQGKFAIYGKSATMIDVGGDYLDFFKIDENSFSVLVGDVAGHGVGAAVIMAMAKAAILIGGDYLRSPALTLNSLHKMILSIKNAKQRKIITFQYLYVNSETGESLYGNAGACSPWLIRHSEQSVQEIKMAGAALGAFKKAVYKEMPLNLKPGDTIVFYTDGIVECKDKSGEMLGYERLKNMLLNCWDENPETYYNNIFKSYTDFVGEGVEAGDDMTFVILMYT